MKIKNNDLKKNPLGYTKGIFCLKKILPFIFLIATTLANAQPKMEIKDVKKNFGVVKRGELVKLEYEAWIIPHSQFYPINRVRLL